MKVQAARTPPQKPTLARPYSAALVRPMTTLYSGSKQAGSVTALRHATAAPRRGLDQLLWSPRDNMMSSMRRSASSPGLMPCSPTDTEAEMSELLAMRGGVTYERRVPGSPAEMDIWYDVKPRSRQTTRSPSVMSACTGSRSSPAPLTSCSPPLAGLKGASMPVPSYKSAPTIQVVHPAPRTAVAPPPSPLHQPVSPPPPPQQQPSMQPQQPPMQQPQQQPQQQQQQQQQQQRTEPQGRGAPAEAAGKVALDEMLRTCDVTVKPPYAAPSLMQQISLIMGINRNATRKETEGPSQPPKPLRGAEHIAMVARQAAARHRQQGHQHAAARKQRHTGSALHLSDRVARPSRLEARRRQDSAAEEQFARSRRRLVEIETQHHREHENYTELAFEMTAAGTYSEREVKAASKFDERHVERSAYAERHLARLKYDPSSLQVQDCMRVSTNLVRRNKYMLPETHNPFAPPPRYHQVFSKKRSVKQWNLEESIWAGRRKHGNSHDYFENADALRRMVESDWRMARMHHGLDHHIVKASRATAAEVKSAERSAGGAFNAPEVIAVEAVLIRHARVVYGAFDYYSVVSRVHKNGVSLFDARGQKIDSLKSAADVLDVHGVSKEGFFRFCAECGFEDDVGCSHSDLKNVWSMINAHDSGTFNRAAETEAHNLVSHLNRHEWLQALVRIAVRLYCRIDPGTGTVHGDVAEALDKMCYSKLAGRLPREATQSSNAFRKAACYTEGTDLVLKRHEGTLRGLFDFYAALGTTSYDDEQHLRDRRLMSCGEWLNFLDATGLFEMRLIPSIHAALMAFQWSRIRSLSEYTNKAEIRLRSMHFEDFLEALVRLATIAAMPTREELDESEAHNVAEFLHALRDDTPGAYDHFVTSRTIGFFDVPPQRAHVLMAGMLDLIYANVAASLEAAAKTAVDQTAQRTAGAPHAASGPHAPHAAPPPPSRAPSRPHKLVRTISMVDLGGAASAPLEQGGGRRGSSFSAAEIAKFGEHRQEGGGIDTTTCRVSGVLGSELVAAMNRIETHIMDSLRGVPAFASLNEEQLQLVRSAMQVAKYRDGERVFKQGDEGSAFFLITGGHCEVLRVKPEDLVVGVEEQENVVCRLHASDCFGERALIYNEPRAASVRAGPGCVLYVVFITRERFEQTLGRPLSEFQEELAAKTRATGGMEQMAPPASDSEVPASEPLD